MQQTCLNLQAQTRTEPSCPSMERTCLNLQAQIRTPNSPILEQTCLNCKHKHLEHPIVQFCNKTLSQSASVQMSSANAEAGEQT